VPIAAAEEVASRTRDARLVVFGESGHCPFLEESDRFNEVVDGWIRSLPPVGPPGAPR
jgi:pimeloyl-ACP methyl ester carboxylesterase